MKAGVRHLFVMVKFRVRVLGKLYTSDCSHRDKSTHTSRKRASVRAREAALSAFMC